MKDTSNGKSDLAPQQSQPRFYPEQLESGSMPVGDKKQQIQPTTMEHFYVLRRSVCDINLIN